jgi:hypothetical protein
MIETVLDGTQLPIFAKRCASEGIDCLSFRTRTHMRTQPILSSNVHVASHDRFQIVRDASIRKEVLSERWRKIDQQIDIAISTVVVARDGTEDGDVHHAARAKLRFVRAKAIENAC